MTHSLVGFFLPFITVGVAGSFDPTRIVYDPTKEGCTMTVEERNHISTPPFLCFQCTLRRVDLFDAQDITSLGTLPSHTMIVVIAFIALFLYPKSSLDYGIMMSLRVAPGWHRGNCREACPIRGIPRRYRSPRLGR